MQFVYPSWEVADPASRLKFRPPVLQAGRDHVVLLSDVWLPCCSVQRHSKLYDISVNSTLF